MDRGLVGLAVVGVTRSAIANSLLPVASDFPVGVIDVISAGVSIPDCTSFCARFASAIWSAEGPMTTGPLPPIACAACAVLTRSSKFVSFIRRCASCCICLTSGDCATLSASPRAPTSIPPTLTFPSLSLSPMTPSLKSP